MLWIQTAAEHVLAVALLAARRQRQLVGSALHAPEHLQDDLAGVVAVAQGHEHEGRRSLPLVNGDVMTGIRLAPQTTRTPWHAVLTIVGTL